MSGWQDGWQEYAPMSEADLMKSPVVRQTVSDIAENSEYEMLRDWAMQMLERYFERSNDLDNFDDPDPKEFARLLEGNDLE